MCTLVHTLRSVTIYDWGCLDQCIPVVIVYIDQVILTEMNLTSYGHQWLPIYVCRDCRHRRPIETHNDNRFMHVHTVGNGLLTIDHRVSIITDFVQINEAVVIRSLDYIEPSITS